MNKIGIVMFIRSLFERDNNIRGKASFWAIVVMMTTSALAVDFAGGTGEPNDPYQIATAEQLISIGDDPKLLDKHYILINDIDLDPNLPGGQVFDRAVIAPDVNDTSRHFQGTAFNGCFDGQSFTIKNLTIDSDSEYAGLFGLIWEDGVVCCIHLIDGSVRGAAIYVSSGGGRCGTGSLAGENRGLVQDCHSDVTVTGLDFVGGLVGENRGVISNSSSSGSVYGEDRVGGLTGFNASGMVLNSYSTGSVNGENGTGGLVGNTSLSSTIINSYSTGSVKGVNSVGGLTGNHHGTVMSSYSTGSVSGTGVYVGGLVGYNYGYVLNNYSTGTVTGNFAVGGLVGYNGFDIVVSNNYSTGVVTGAHDVGGLVGANNGTVLNSFWDKEASGIQESAGGRGLITTQMQKLDTFLEAGWDFTGERENGTSEMWLMPTEGGYPKLSILTGYVPELLEGSGILEDPYIVETPDDLGTLWYRPTACYQLTEDLDMSGIIWSTAVIPVFAGWFEGQDHKILNLSIKGADHLGLIGFLNQNSSVLNLGLEDVNIVGRADYIGGLVGRNSRGTIANSYSAGSVNGHSSVGSLVGSNDNGIISNSYSMSSIDGTYYVGGLVGYNSGRVLNSYNTDSVSGLDHVGGLVGYNSGRVSNSYNTDSVNGWGHVGGLVGYNSGSIISNYSTGVVTGSGNVGGLVGGSYHGSIGFCYSTGMVTGGGNVGGLVGYRYSSIVSNSLWDIETSDQIGSDGGVGLTKAEMMDPKMVGLNGWANDPNWVLDPGRDYPRIAWQETPGNKIDQPIINMFSGTGTSNNPYCIDQYDQLIILSKASILWDRHFRLREDIDFDPNLPGHNIFGQAVIPSFSGVFDGDDHVISNLWIMGNNHIGLFGELEPEAKVRNLGLVHMNISGGYYVGGLAGQSSGTIESSYSMGTLSGGTYRVGGLVGENYGSVTDSFFIGSASGRSDIGGLVGRNDDGTILNSFSNGSVSGRSDVGGLVGSNNNGIISNSYSTATVSGTDDAGGLVGYNDYFGSINFCYSVGMVATGNRDIGGMVGRNISSIVLNSFWDTETSGQSRGYGGVGLTTTEMQDINTYLDADWNFDDIWMICEGKDYPHLQWEGILCE